MTDILRKERRISPGAIVLFLAVYAAALMLVLGPKDLFTATPGSLTDTASN
jgi:hypothetical protein